MNRFDFVTDTYRKSSIKNFERKNRRTNKPFLVKCSLTKMPRNWSSFMANENNKIQIIQFLLKECKNKYALK